MIYSNIKEFIKAEQLKDEGKYIEALQIVSNIEKKGNLKPVEQFKCLLLKSTCLNRLGQRKKALKFAQQAYQKSQKQERDLELIDASIEMAEALEELGKIDKAFDIIIKCENLLKTITQCSVKELKQREASLTFIKGIIYHEKSELDRALENLEQSLELQEELGNKQDIARTLTWFGVIFFLKGELDHALEYYKRAWALEENSFNENVSQILMGFQIVYSSIGELDISLKYAKRGLAFSEKLKNKLYIGMFFNNIGLIYQQQGDLDGALEYLKRSLACMEEYGNNLLIFFVLDSIFNVALEMNSLEQARQYLNRIKQIKDREESKWIDAGYRVEKALILRKSLQASDQVKAKEILKQSVEEEVVNHEITVMALLNLCNLLLNELRNTNNLEILDEIYPYITRIHNIAKNQHSYWLLAETDILQAKLDLLTLDLEKSKASLTQAQLIAEKYNLTRLNIKISKEKKELLKQLNKWENLKKKKSFITERMELAHLDDQIVRMLHKRFYLK